MSLTILIPYLKNSIYETRGDLTSYLQEMITDDGSVLVDLLSFIEGEMFCHFDPKWEREGYMLSKSCLVVK